MGMIGHLCRATAGQLKELHEDPEAMDEFLEDEGNAEFDFDKSWHAIHFLLTGSAWEGEPPLNFIGSGGKEVGDYDPPARSFTPAEVKSLSNALEPIDEQQLRSRFEPQKLKAAEIYPDIWDRLPEEDDTLGCVVEFYKAMKPFIAETASKGDGLIFYIS